MQPIFFNKAGNLLLERYRCGKPSRAEGDAIYQLGAVVSITPTVNVNTATLEDGNSDWAAATPVTGREGSLAVQLSFMSPQLYAFLVGVDLEVIPTTTMTDVNFEEVISEVAPFVIKLPNIATGDDENSIMVSDANGKRFKKVEAPIDPEVLKVGEFSVEDDVVTFAEADSGKVVHITYDWTALDVTSFAFPKSGTPFSFRTTISGEAMGDDESTMYDTNIIIDRSKATGNINPPPLSKTPAAQTITLQVQKPRGDKAVDFKFARKGGECD